MVYNNYSQENTIVNGSSIATTNVANFVFGFLILALGFLAVFGNGFILLVMAKYQALRNNLCNMLIGILAIADFASGIGLLMRGISDQVFYITDYHGYTKVECLAIGYVGLFSVHMSQLVTLFIAVDRLKAVRDPFNYAAQDKLKTSLRALIFSIVYPLFGTSLAFVGLDYNSHPEICETGNSVPNYYPAYWILFALIVAIVIFYSYARISWLLKSKLRNVKSLIEKRDLKRQRDVFKVIRIVLIVYAICWCVPNFLVVVGTVLNANEVIMANLSSLIAVGTGINSSGNLFIYAWKHQEIGEHMRIFLNLKSSPSNRQPASTTREAQAAAAAKRLSLAAAFARVQPVSVL